MIKLFVAFAFLFYAVLASPSVNRCGKHLNLSSQQRIIDGVDAPNLVPYLVSLRLKPMGNKHICGGAILSENWILTAAHCINTEVIEDYIFPREIKIKPEHIQIRAGNNYLSKQSDIYDVQDIKLNEKWNYRTGKNDIALLKTVSMIKIDNDRIMSIRMDKKIVQPNAYASICGWGKIDLNNTNMDCLQCLNQTIMLNKDCHVPMGGQGISKSQICTAGQRNKAVYSGDSGGPLIRNEKIIGIVSFGPDGTGKPNVFTRMSSYVHWVKKVMKKY